ncbi:MAG: glycosyltransferase [Caldiserica bacterium]|nr:glycosyltransferase [Caldisericota bacterium]
MSDERQRLKVTIVTKNRPDDLGRTSLPSLARQTCPSSFGILVWDASDDDRTDLVAAEFAAQHSSLRLQYEHAPRAGTSSQRNDALGSCVSDFIFYVDDDVELFPMAIAELLRAFDTDCGSMND